MSPPHCEVAFDYRKDMVQFLPFFNFGSAAFAFIAALLWFYSAVVRVKYDETPDKDGMIPGAIVDDHNNDILASQARGNKLSAAAAIASGLAALLQALAIWNTPG